MHHRARPTTDCVPATHGSSHVARRAVVPFVAQQHNSRPIALLAATVMSALAAHAQPLPFERPPEGNGLAGVLHPDTVPPIVIKMLELPLPEDPNEDQFGKWLGRQTAKTKALKVPKYDVAAFLGNIGNRVKKKKDKSA